MLTLDQVIQYSNHVFTKWGVDYRAIRAQFIRSEYCSYAEQYLHDYYIYDDQGREHHLSIWKENRPVLQDFKINGVAYYGEF